MCTVSPEEIVNRGSSARFQREWVGSAVNRNSAMSLHFPGFPVETRGFDELHAVFFKENRTRVTCRQREAGNPGSVGMTIHIATIICSSTSALRGNALTPTAARTWRPGSPNTSSNKSDAPLMTAGESGKPATALT
jgi:hypothetical protein